MNTNERRTVLEKILRGTKEPITATSLAEQFGVSRQIIVGDVAILRASGVHISATPRGYLMEEEQREKLYTIACQHQQDRLQEELYTITDLGGHILDVIVEHPIYGQIIGQLHIRSRFDVDRFCTQLQETQAPPLSLLTEGIHLHTISCADHDTYVRILNALRRKKLLVE